ncbi:(Fe-S)-binding protein [Azospirillum sp. RWY-5-1]|uniref:(Fe-S)-binding protein n=1 Tax=Azospirillum oleiclasticum TaxID=2735135 RepID=A0ABX2T5S7_9PROT|nr:(Fe-S)-binding protein [Azospirillum oleiclasticum]NYZ11491.1 (Fe-S)-binding protein [Azospirillum oleiclasticum]NYZ18652.1 (Fe-S)-binding protein [Azospirillum oleiclasticum]
MSQERPSTVYYFGTCLIDLFYPEAGMAGIELLQGQGVRVVFPQGQSCCGQPAYNSGYRDEARKVARAQLALFTEDWPVVVPSGSCAGMMKKHWPELFHGTPDQARAEAVAGRVWELTQFLVNVLDIRLEDKGEPLRITWHASCHAQREMGVVDEPKALLRQLRNVELVELAREKECCGFGGTFAVRHPEISAAMVGDKIADIENTGAKAVVSGDCGCLLNITGALEAGKRPVRGQHIAQFLKERTHG